MKKASLDHVDNVRPRRTKKAFDPYRRVKRNRK